MRRCGWVGGNVKNSQGVEDAGRTDGIQLGFGLIDNQVIDGTCHGHAALGHALTSQYIDYRNVIDTPYIAIAVAIDQRIGGTDNLTIGADKFWHAGKCT